MAPRTLYDKIWDDHTVHIQDGNSALLYIDRHLLNEVSCPQAFEGLRDAGRPVRRTDCTLATTDHNVPTTSRKNFTTLQTLIDEPDSLAQCIAMEENVKYFGVPYFGMKDKRQGIVHIIGPEQGFTLPGITCVCGDSHTSTHGAFGALAFGIGTSEVEHVLATQTLLQRKSKNMRISINGKIGEGVTSKDVILHTIGVISMSGGTGCVIEYAGDVIRNMSMEARMSVCNMSIEAGARAGMIAPDDTTFAYIKHRPLAPPVGPEWDRAVKYWRTLYSDPDAKFDIEVSIRAEDIAPTVSWGTSPQDVVPITGSVPDPKSFPDATRQKSAQRALEYMGLEPHTKMEDIVIERVFLGSCTNARIEDLRSIARVVLAAGPNAKVANGINAMVVPGSGLVRQQAEAEGIDTVLKRAGFDWREAGCSMCLGMNPDQLRPRERCASTSNRNFEGRQGAGGRTHLVSPAMGAAAAMTGKLTDVRAFMRKAGKTGEQLDKEGGLKVVSAAQFVLSGVVVPPPAPERKETVSANDTAGGAGSAAKTFKELKGIACPFAMENCDTDVIIPKQFLKTLKRTGLAGALFFTLRNDPSTGEKKDFILDKAPYDKSKILVCIGQNFGCGSSREHAAWSLNDFGIRCVIAPSFGDIFKNNCMQNGMLPVTLPKEQCQVLYGDAEAGKELEVDLEREEVRRASGEVFKFTTDAFRRHCLLNGLDDIGLTMQKVDKISGFEKQRSEYWPWLDGFRYIKEGVVPVQPSAKTQTTIDW